MALLNRKKTIDTEYVFPGRFGGHKTIHNNQTLKAAFRRAGTTDVSSNNLRKTFAPRLLSRGAAITDVQHLLGHAFVKTIEKAYAAFVKTEKFDEFRTANIVRMARAVECQKLANSEVSEWRRPLGWSFCLCAG